MLMIEHYRVALFVWCLVVYHVCVWADEIVVWLIFQVLQIFTRWLHIDLWWFCFLFILYTQRYNASNRLLSRTSFPTFYFLHALKRFCCSRLLRKSLLLKKPMFNWNTWAYKGMQIQLEYMMWEWSKSPWILNMLCYLKNNPL